MTPLFKKMNFKDQKELIILNAPKSLDQEIIEMSKITNVVKDAKPKAFEFLLAFVTKQAEVDVIAQDWLPKANGDVITYIAYPKQSSKNYKCEFNRDNGWQRIGDAGWEGVRMVAVDEDWSALRFRDVKYVKTMTRTFAMTEEGKAKANSNKI